MTKDEFISRIADRFETRKQAAEAVDAVLSGIAESLKEGETVQLTGFGKFGVATRGARQGINPRTGERITIAPGRVPRFSPGRTLKESVRASLPGDPGEDYGPSLSGDPAEDYGPSGDPGEDY